MNEPFDGFTVQLSQDEDHDWMANLLELPNVSAFGSTPDEALRELETAWLAMKESYLKHNEPIPLAPSKKQYSGQFNVRIDRRVHRQLAIEAAQAGVTLNALVAQKLLLAVTKKAI